jgi:hypothetical protein
METEVSGLAERPDARDGAARRGKRPLRLHLASTASTRTKPHRLLHHAVTSASHRHCSRAGTAHHSRMEEIYKFLRTTHAIYYQNPGGIAITSRIAGEYEIKAVTLT